MADDVFDPVNGLKDTVVFPTDPVDETAARKQFQDMLDQMLVFHNAHTASYTAHGLTANTTVYVNGSTGNDTTGDGTSGNPYATIQKAVNVLPHVAHGNYSATLSITAGTYAEVVNISNLPYTIFLYSAGTVTISGLDLYCSAVVLSANIAVVNTNRTTIVTLSRNAHLYVNDKTLTVTNPNATAGAIGILADIGATLQTAVASGALSVSDCTYGIAANGTGQIYADSITGSGNTTGLRAWGGKISYNSLAGGFATTAHSAARGGRIYTGSQASVPSY
jgi:hypothetical protein